MYQGNFPFLISYIYSIPYFPAYANFCRIFSAKQKPRISPGQNAFSGHIRPNLSVFQQQLLSHTHHLLLPYQDRQFLRLQKFSRLPSLLRCHLLFSRHPQASTLLPHQRNRTGFQSTCSSFRSSRSGVF